MNVPAFAPHLLEYMQRKNPRRERFMKLYIAYLQRGKATLEMIDYANSLNKKALRRVEFINRYLFQNSRS